MQTFALKKTLARFVKIYLKTDSAVPKQLLNAVAEKPDTSSIRYPLPSRKNDYTCFCKTAKALWMGAPNGVTRWCENAENEYDKVMYFSAKRDLEENCVDAIIADEESETEAVWVLTGNFVSHITLKEISPEEKAEILTQETLNYVSRRGMVTQRKLTVPREPSTRVPYGHSDNSGTFTAGFAIGELCKYAVFKKKYGTDDERTVKARKSAMRATEACLLLMYIPGRGDGFVARTYIVPTEPLPDDGLFYRKENGKAVCLPTTCAKYKGLAYKEVDASTPVPERLAHLYKDDGYSDDGIIYKGDTSSDEITLHYLHMYFAHEILGVEDKELDELIINAAKATLSHIIRNGYELLECNGKPTTWAKWSLRYFATHLGWSDGCLNACEVLMYHKVVMHLTGEKGEWQASYDKLVNELGYADLTTLHDARFHVSAGVSGNEQVEELMYGDNMLATASYWMLINLEDNSELKEKYRLGYKGWNGTFRREHNPAYDFPYMLSCPDDKIDTDRLAEWFARQNISRLATSVSVNTRFDTAEKIRFGGLRETSWLLPPDENFISKYDRDPYYYSEGDYGDGVKLLESCYVYTFAYWLGRYYGFIEEED